MSDALYTSSEFFHPFPDAGDVFALNVEEHAKYLLPLATIDLSAMSPSLDGKIHFIQTVEPIDGVVGEGGNDFFTHTCRENWIGYRYQSGKCHLACDFQIFHYNRLQRITSPSTRESELQAIYASHYDDVHAGFARAKAHFHEHRSLHPMTYKPPFTDSQRLPMLAAFGGDSEAHSCNWTASCFGMPLVRHSDNHSAPQTEDGRDFLYIGELCSGNYIWANTYVLGCELLLFYDPRTETSVTTFDWS